MKFIFKKISSLSLSLSLSLSRVMAFFKDSHLYFSYDIVKQNVHYYFAKIFAG